MIKVTYLNNFDEICIRHGSIQRENGITLFIPNDTTKKIEIPKEKLINIEELTYEKTKTI